MPNRYGGELRSAHDPVSPRESSTGGDQDNAALGGVPFYGEGSPEDAPRYGDWSRHSTGSGSGARGQEGLSFPDEDSWGESQRAREQAEISGGRPARNRRTRRRTDQSIRQEIAELLAENPDLETDDIEIEVEGGEVTLSGRVESQDARWLVEDLVELVSGVALVHNRLRVEQ